MRLCRYRDRRSGSTHVGIVEADGIRDATAALDDLPAYRYPLPPLDPFIAALPSISERLRKIASDAPSRSLASVDLLSPIANPGKIIAAPVNYRDHLDEARADAQIHHQNRIAEIQRAGLFLKATSSLAGAGEGVRIRHPERRNDHEIELVAVIGRKVSRIERADALSCVAGYCIGLDMTTRGPEERSLRKSIDTYAVLGPWLVTADELADPSNLELLLTVNGESRQRANTRDLIIDVAGLIALASSFYTLWPGDVLFTGTPAGVGPVQSGDIIRASIDSLGSMEVAVLNESWSARA